MVTPGGQTVTAPITCSWGWTQFRWMLITTLLLTQRLTYNDCSSSLIIQPIIILGESLLTQTRSSMSQYACHTVQGTCFHFYNPADWHSHQCTPIQLLGILPHILFVLLSVSNAKCPSTQLLYQGECCLTSVGSLQWWALHSMHTMSCGSALVSI